MNLPWLALLPLLLALAGYGTLRAVDHPDEVTATRAWMEQAGRSSAAARTGAAPGPADAAADETPDGDNADLPDPFQLREAATAEPSRQAGSRVRERERERQREHEREGDEDEGRPAQAAAPAVAVLSPAPGLRLLGTLRRDEHWIAIIDVEGSTRQLQSGDALPGSLGRVLAVREEAIDIGREDGQRQTISLASLPASSALAVTAPPLPSARSTARNARTARRRLIRPGVTP
ncbi:hypothetical protein FEE59_05860 [Herbaspirillum sp. RU 5E]|nr:hypothetical protein [Herbaspirillum sp. RU 5E]